MKNISKTGSLMLTRSNGLRTTTCLIIKEQKLYCCSEYY